MLLFFDLGELKSELKSRDEPWTWRKQVASAAAASLRASASTTKSPVPILPPKPYADTVVTKLLTKGIFHRSSQNWEAAHRPVEGSKKGALSAMSSMVKHGAWDARLHGRGVPGFRLCASDASILSLLFLLAQLDLGCKCHAAVADMQRYQVSVAPSLQSQTCCRHCRLTLHR